MIWILVGAYGCIIIIKPRSKFAWFVLAVHFLIFSLVISEYGPEHLITPPENDLYWYVWVLSIILAIPLSLLLMAAVDASQSLNRCVKDRLVLGPLSESITMIIFVLPIVASVVYLVHRSEISSALETFSIVCMGMFFSNIIASPFNRFIYAIMRLSTEHDSGEIG